MVFSVVSGITDKSWTHLALKHTELEDDVESERDGEPTARHTMPRLALASGHMGRRTRLNWWNVSWCVASRQNCRRRSTLSRSADTVQVQLVHVNSPSGAGGRARTECERAAVVEEQAGGARGADAQRQGVRHGRSIYSAATRSILYIRAATDAACSRPLTEAAQVSVHGGRSAARCLPRKRVPMQSCVARPHDATLHFERNFSGGLLYIPSVSAKVWLKWPFGFRIVIRRINRRIIPRIPRNPRCHRLPSHRATPCMIRAKR